MIIVWVSILRARPQYVFDIVIKTDMTKHKKERYVVLSAVETTDNTPTPHTVENTVHRIILRVVLYLRKRVLSLISCTFY